MGRWGVDWLSRSHPQLKEGLFDFGIESVSGLTALDGEAVEPNYDEETLKNLKESLRDAGWDEEMLDDDGLLYDVFVGAPDPPIAPVYHVTFAEPCKLNPVEWYDRASVQSSDGKILRRVSRRSGTIIGTTPRAFRDVPPV